ncbi:MAG: RNA-binding protein, partial [Ruminococcaceae bacterium]|nr:RNA-binding protein [Oscillospiraceae bacterium]
YGGYADASRKIFAAAEVVDEDFPLRAVTFFFRKQDNLTHRNFLGTLMSLGINRDLIGDIRVGQGEAIIFVSSAAASLVLNEVAKIGKVGVRAEEGIHAEIPAQEYDVLPQTVSSLRADAVVSAVCGVSREKSSSLIRSGSVVLSGVQLDSVSDNIEVGEVFSIKGYGKYILSDIGNTTKKGKVHITIKKYK